MGNYDDIIHLPHHVSTKHPQMSTLDRAAQFSPFAALTGHSAAIAETGRLTDTRHELDEDKKEELDQKLQIIKKHAAKKPEIAVTYFVPDDQKEGGSYQQVTGAIKKFDASFPKIIMQNGTIIPIKDIYEVEILNAAWKNI